MMFLLTPEGVNFNFHSPTMEDNDVFFLEPA